MQAPGYQSARKCLPPQTLRRDVDQGKVAYVAGERIRRKHFVKRSDQTRPLKNKSVFHTLPSRQTAMGGRRPLRAWISM
jgi:hypothetical protein